MLFWLVAAALTAVALALLLGPLVRRHPQPLAARADYDIEVFRDQLRELERDRRRGTIGAAEAAAAKLEIERRLLAADAARATEGAPATAGAGRAVAMTAIAIGLPLAAFVLYSQLGAPGTPDLPLAARNLPQQPAATQPPPAAAPDMSTALARVRARLEENPESLEDWLLLGRTLVELGRVEQALEAYDWARKVSGDRPDVISAYGEALVMMADGTVTEGALKAFKEANAGDPAEPRARYYLALADFQAGRKDAAVEAWAALANDSPAGAPWLQGLEARVRAVAADLDRDPDALLVARTESPRGPTQEDIAAASQMAPADQQEMIRGMVDGLAAKLAANPDDVAGWARLARSYGVLGERDKARQAIGEAVRRLDRAPPGVAAEVRDIAGQLGVEIAAPGPSAADVAAAQDMAPDDRSAMIRGMVDGLAARLEDAPGDLDGWLRLGRAYSVLGEADKAAEAYGRAAALAPQDLAVQRAYADALRASADPSAGLPPRYLAQMEAILALAPDDRDALWFTGLRRLNAGDAAGAIPLWERLLAQLPPDGADYAFVSRELDALRAAVR